MYSRVQKNMRFGAAATVFALFFFAGALSVSAGVSLLTNAPSPLYSGNTFTATASLTYDGDSWGQTSCGVAVQIDGSTCNWTTGTISGPNAGGASISTSCTVTAGAAGTTVSVNSAYRIGGGSW